jgi:uncharacterized repeat protein (TIGR03803 family)
MERPPEVEAEIAGTAPALWLVVERRLNCLMPQARDGQKTVLHSFLGYRSHDGQTPAGSLILDGSGNLYGTTFNGGTGKPMCAVPIGCGTVFELSPGTGGWNESILHDFLGGAKDGSNPSGPLLRDTLGNLYGNTGDGGANNFGTVFKLVYSGGTWTESVLISFQSGPNDGIYPTGALAMDTSGNVYGTTGSGGAAGGACNCGEGIVFEIKP